MRNYTEYIVTQLSEKCNELDICGRRPRWFDYGYSQIPDMVIIWLRTNCIFIAAASGFLAFVGLTFLGAMISVCISIPVSYAYSMAHLIMADYPGVGAIEALRLSRQMMRGNKFRLFCLDFSFIGWDLLAACCTCGIGYYFLTPYQHVSHAAFYEEISGRKTSEDVEFPSIDPNDYIVE